MPGKPKDSYPVFPPKSTRHILPFRIFGPKVDLATLHASESPESLTRSLRGQLEGLDPSEVEYWPTGVHLDRWYPEPVFIFDCKDIHRISERTCKHQREGNTVASLGVEERLKAVINRISIVPVESLVKHEQTNEADANVICESIKKEGSWLVPLVASRQGKKYFVVDGMHRTEAAIYLQTPNIPIVDYDYEKEVCLGRWLRILSGWTSKGFHQRIAKLEDDPEIQLQKLADYDLAKRGGVLRVMATDMAVLWIEDKLKWSIYAPRVHWSERYSPMQAYRILLSRVDSTFGFDPRSRRSLKGHYVGEDEQPSYLSGKRQIVIFPPPLTNRQLLEAMQGPLSH